jgi:hypothetical protein
VAAAVAGLLALAPAAHAAPAPPPPTVSITTSVGGQPLPVSPMTGSWKVAKPGRRASLKVTGIVATGTETTIRSTWLSSMHRSIGIKFSCGGSFDTVAPGSAENTVAMRVEFRTPHGHWQDLGGTRFGYVSQPLSGGGQGVGALIEFLHPVTVQWRVTVTAVYADTSQETFTEQVQAV